MKKTNKTNYGVFLNAMIVNCSSMVNEFKDEYDAGTFWMNQYTDKFSLMAVNITLPDSNLEVWIRFTSTKKWFQIDCGPVSKRVSYTSDGADIISNSINEITSWIRDYFDEPESVDASLLVRPTITDEKPLLWTVEGIEYKEPPTPIQNTYMATADH
ncbi:MAG: hypothetical protein HQL74_15265 [Magnetococcales bacterium]|nr:hypothetical protein [Magnetococcales bacterium]